MGAIIITSIITIPFIINKCQYNQQLSLILVMVNDIFEQPKMIQVLTKLSNDIFLASKCVQFKYVTQTPDMFTVV